jgi:hypothetical protein
MDVPSIAIPGMAIPGMAIPGMAIPDKQFDHLNNLGLTMDALLVAP